ncbi:MAG: CzcE family metal-binding protein [Burkholderiaceae bacterium]
MLLLSSCTTMVDQSKQLALWGDPVSPSIATRTIIIGHDTKYVNVEGGEIVKFVANDQAFAWAFAPQGGAYFELNNIAPAGALDHRVMASVATPQRYLPNW